MDRQINEMMAAREAIRDMLAEWGSTDCRRDSRRRCRLITVD